jgi:quercetin dioxygenase-like cupin family protein
MASKGERFEMADGSVYVVTKPTAETGGEYVEMEFILPPGSFAPPPHIHPSQVEEYELIEGGFEVMVDGEWTSLGPGERASVPIGSLHTFRNPTEETTRVRNWHRPALRFEQFIERANATLAAAGVKGGRDPRLPVYMSMLFAEFPETLQTPRRRERIPMGVLARLGRLLRLRTVDPS